MKLETLKRRSEFLAMRRGVRWQTPAFVLLARRAASERADAPPRFGFTVTRRLGKAVVRNRVRRRLREAVRSLAEGRARPGHDYVLIARPGALERDFAALRADLEKALDRVHGRLADEQQGAARRQRGQRERSPVAGRSEPHDDA